MDWQPIETFDYETERAKQGSMFVAAWVSDGARVELAEHWGPPETGDDGDLGWREALNVGDDGPDPIGFKPTHWIGKPAPPSALSHEQS